MRCTHLRAMAAAIAAAAVLVSAAPAGAIVGGSADTVHTNVGLVRFTTADGRFRCSGTLISATRRAHRRPLHGGPGDRRLRVVRRRPRSSIRCSRGSRQRRRRHARRTTSPAPPIPIRAGTGKLSASPSSTTRASSCSTHRPRPSGTSRRRRCRRSGYLDQTRARSRTRPSRSSATASTSAPRRRRSSSTSALDDVLPQERPERGRRLPDQPKDSKAGGGSCFGDPAALCSWAVRAGRRLLRELAHLQRDGSYQRADTTYSRAFLRFWISRVGSRRATAAVTVPVGWPPRGGQLSGRSDRPAYR